MSPSPPAPDAAFQAGQPVKGWQMGRELVLSRAQGPAPSLKQTEPIMSEMHKALLENVLRLDLETERLEPRRSARRGSVQTLQAQQSQHSTHPRGSWSVRRLCGPTTQSHPDLTQPPTPCHQLGKFKTLSWREQNREQAEVLQPI